MNEEFSILSNVIRNRRSIKPALMNGGKIPDEEMRQILSYADWAPTHGRTEPWRFIVYSGEKVPWFCREHAALYKLNTPAERFVPATYEKLMQNGDLVSHVVVAVMQRGHLPKIPVLEEIAATAAAIQNVLLAAAAAGIASFWSTGGMTHHESMRKYLNLFEEDIVLGILYFGYSDQRPEGKRNIPFEHKMKWLDSSAFPGRDD